MRTAAIVIKNRFRMIALILLTGFILSSTPAGSETLTRPQLAQIRSEIRTTLLVLQREIMAKGHSFTVGYSPAMEYSIPQLCGLVKPNDWRNHAIFEKMEAYLTALPPSFDWRDLGGDTPVRNQGGCGSCWAFGTVQPLEILLSARCGKVVDLSEQYLVSCNENGYGCGGGWFAHGYHEWYVPATMDETDAGAVLEVNFPYQAANVACNGPHAHPYKINAWYYIAGYTVPSVAAIKQAIQNYGPVAASVCVGSAFQAYSSGIFDYQETCSGDVNHAVTLVGWNDDLGTDNGYWILKNSWGSAWGESGYMRIRYGVSKVGYAANFVDFTNCGDPDPAPAPPCLDCNNAPSLTPGTLYRGQTTVDGPSDISTYGCSGRTESGPEKVYQVSTSSTGDLTAALTNLGTTDLDVFILSACDPTSCLAFGETAAIYANAPPGTYYIVVEGNNGASGTFDLQATVARRLPDLSGAWTSLASYSKGKTVYGTLRVSNIGSADVGSFKVAYYLSKDGKTAAELLLTQTAASGVRAGQELYLNSQFSSRTSLSGKFIIARIDYEGKIVEKTETNNSIAKQVP
jgi:C1A family cysteine protease